MTLAAYVGEDVIIRYDPRDMAEIRVFHGDRFLCRAVCQELADQTISLKELVQARRERRRQLRAELATRNEAVALLLEVHRPVAPPAPPAAEPDRPKLKRYYND